MPLGNAGGDDGRPGHRPDEKWEKRENMRMLIVVDNEREMVRREIKEAMRDKKEGGVRKKRE